MYGCPDRHEDNRSAKVASVKRNALNTAARRVEERLIPPNAATLMKNDQSYRKKITELRGIIAKGTI